MDKATIDAMRTVVEASEKRGRSYQGSTLVYVDDVPIDHGLYTAGFEGLRTLVDEAAAKAARTEGDADGRIGEAKVVRRFLKTLDEMVQACDALGNQEILLAVESEHRRLNAEFTRVAIQTIEALLAATPEPEPEPAKPTLEECVAAMNRAKHRGQSDWKAQLFTRAGIHWLNLDEFTALGRLLIDRERADAAKGGA